MSSKPRQSYNLKRYECKVGKYNAFCRICFASFDSPDDNSVQSAAQQIYHTQQTILSKQIYTDRHQMHVCTCCKYIYHKSCYEGFGLNTSTTKKRVRCYLSKDKAAKRKCVVCESTRDLLYPVQNQNKVIYAHIPCMFYSPDFAMITDQPIRFMLLRNLDDVKPEEGAQQFSCCICRAKIVTRNSYFECNKEGCEMKAHIFCCLLTYYCAREFDINREKNPSGEPHDPSVSCVPLLHMQRMFDVEAQPMSNEALLYFLSQSPAYNEHNNKDDIVEKIRAKLQDLALPSKAVCIKMYCDNHVTKDNMFCNNDCVDESFVYCDGCYGWFHSKAECNIVKEFTLEHCKPEFIEKVRESGLEIKDLTGMAITEWHEIYFYYCCYCINYTYTCAYKDEYIAPALSFRVFRDVLDFAIRFHNTIKADHMSALLSSFTRLIYLKDESLQLPMLLDNMICDMMEEEKVVEPPKQEFDEDADYLYEYLQNMEEPNYKALLKFLEVKHEEILIHIKESDKRSKNARKRQYYNVLRKIMLDFFGRDTCQAIRLLNKIANKIAAYPDFKFAVDSFSLFSSMMRNHYIDPLQETLKELNDLVVKKNSFIVKNMQAFNEGSDITAASVLNCLKNKITRSDLDKMTLSKQYADDTNNFIYGVLQEKYIIETEVPESFADMSFADIQESFNDLLMSTYYEEEDEQKIKRYLEDYFLLIKEHREIKALYFRIKMLKSISRKDFLMDKENTSTIVMCSEIQRVKTFRFYGILSALYRDDLQSSESPELIQQLEAKVKSVIDGSYKVDKLKVFIKDLADIIISKGLAITPMLRNFIQGHINIYRLKHFLKGKLGNYTLEQMEALRAEVSEDTDDCFRIEKLDSAISECRKIDSEVEKEFRPGVNYSQPLHELFINLYNSASQYFLHNPKLELFKQNFDFLSELTCIETREHFIDLENNEPLNITTAFTQLEAVTDLDKLESLRKLKLERPMMKEVEYLSCDLYEKYKKALAHHFVVKSPKIYGHILSAETSAILKEDCPEQYEKAYNNLKGKLQAIARFYDDVSRTTDFNARAYDFNKTLQQILDGFEDFEIDSPLLIEHLDFLFKIKFKFHLLTLMLELIELDKNADAFRTYVNHKATYSNIICFMNEMKVTSSHFKPQKIYIKFQEAFAHITEVDNRITSLKRQIEISAYNEEPLEKRLHVQTAVDDLGFIGQYTFINVELIGMVKNEIANFNKVKQHAYDFISNLMNMHIKDVKIKRGGIENEIAIVEKVRIVDDDILEYNKLLKALVDFVNKEECSFNEFSESKKVICMSIMAIYEEKRYQKVFYDELKTLEDRMGQIRNNFKKLKKSIETVQNFCHIIQDANDFIKYSPYQVYFFHESYKAMKDELALVTSISEGNYEPHFSMNAKKTTKLQLPREIGDSLADIKKKIDKINEYFTDCCKPTDKSDAYTNVMLYQSCRHTLKNMTECYIPIVKARLQIVSATRNSFFKKSDELYNKLRLLLTMIQSITDNKGLIELDKLIYPAEFDLNTLFATSPPSILPDESDAYKLTLWIYKMFYFLAKIRNGANEQTSFVYDDNFKDAAAKYFKSGTDSKSKKKKHNLYLKYLEILLSFFQSALNSSIMTDILNKLSHTLKQTPALTPNRTSLFYSTTTTIKTIDELYDIGIKNIHGSSCFVVKYAQNNAVEILDKTSKDFLETLFGMKIKNTLDNHIYDTVLKEMIMQNNFFSDTSEVKDSLKALSRIATSKIKMLSKEVDKKQYCKAIRSAISKLNNDARLSKNFEESKFSFDWIEKNILANQTNIDMAKRTRQVDDTDEMSSEQLHNTSSKKSSLEDRPSSIERSIKKEMKPATSMMDESVTPKHKAAIKENFLKSFKKVRTNDMIFDYFDKCSKARAFTIIYSRMEYNEPLNIILWTKQHPMSFKFLDKMEIYLKLFPAAISTTEAEILNCLKSQSLTDQNASVIPGWLEIPETSNNASLIKGLKNLQSGNVFVNPFYSNGLTYSFTIGKYINFSPKIRELIQYVDHCMKDKPSYDSLYAFFIKKEQNQSGAAMEMEQEIEQEESKNFDICDKIVNQEPIEKEWTSYTQIGNYKDCQSSDPNKMYYPW